ncbi:MAG: 4,5-DOPA dioxygenase extradiol [Pseudomonadota bacterium]|nr:4,5-DOPA dioxygenase extradiol [Pseudomonadota bacterium]
MRRSIPARRLPALFIGHGSPLNAVEKNVYTDSWSCLGGGIGKPRGILVISAHWLTDGIEVTAMEQPRTLHDFHEQFPQLMDFRYPAPGSSQLAARVQELLTGENVRYSQSWGFDQGVWSVLNHLYPAADVPVVQMSIHVRQSLAWHYATGQKLRALRDEGYLLIGSGNLVYNPIMADYQHEKFAYDWALNFQKKVATHILNGNDEALLDLAALGKESGLAVPANDHFLPLIYTLATRDVDDDAVEFITPDCIYGSVSMLSLALWPSADPG